MSTFSEEVHHECETNEEEDPRRSSDVESAMFHLKTSDHSFVVLPDELLVKVLTHLTLKEQFRVRAVNRQWCRCALLNVSSLCLHLSGYDIILSPTKKIPQKEMLICSNSYHQVIAIFEIFGGSTIGRLHFELDDDFKGFQRKYLVGPLQQKLVEMAQRAKTFSVCLHIDFAKDDGAFFSFCDIFMPWVTQLDLTVQNADPLTFPERFIDTLSKMRKLNAICGVAAPLFLWALGGGADGWPQVSEEYDRRWEYNCSLSREQLDTVSVICRERIKRIAIFELTLPDLRLDPIERVLALANLEQLWLRFDYVEGSELNLVTEVLQKASTACPKLKSLCLCRQMQMRQLADTVDLLKAIGQLKSLQVLKLCLEFSVDGAAVQMMAPVQPIQNGSNVKEFFGHLKNPPLPVWRMLSEMLCNVERIHISNCFMHDLARFTNFSQLKCLEVTDVIVTENSRMNYAAIVDILASCPMLTNLRVRHLCFMLPVSYTLTQCAHLDPHFGPLALLFESFIAQAKIRMERHCDLVVTIPGSQRETDQWATYEGSIPRNLTLVFDHDIYPSESSLDCKCFPSFENEF